VWKTEGSLHRAIEKLLGGEDKTPKPYREKSQNWADREPGQEEVIQTSSEKSKTSRVVRGLSKHDLDLFMRERGKIRINKGRRNKEEKRSEPSEGPYRSRKNSNWGEKRTQR